MELTTVADDEAVAFEDGQSRRFDRLAADTDYSFDGLSFRTLPRPGELLCRFATVNDIHLGETVCGLMEGIDLGPVFYAAEGEDPYPEVMSRAAVAEMAAIDPAVVVVKGDITAHGTEAEYRRFLDFFGPVFGERLHTIRGNHDSPLTEAVMSSDPSVVELPGVRLALIDTSLPGRASGAVSTETIDWLDTIGGAPDDRPVLVFGHHPPWNPASPDPNEDYFGINPSDSVRLVEVVARRPRIAGYLAGHTHRNRVRRFAASGSVPWVEVACVKDFPGAWAEYRVFERGVLQIHRRIAATDALAWTEKTRGMFAGLYGDYAFGSLDDRCFVIAGDRFGDGR